MRFTTVCASVTFAAALSLSTLADVVSAAECTATELEAIDALDSQIEGAAECKALSDKELSEVSAEALCAATLCLEVIKKAVLAAPACTEDGVSSVAFIQLLIDSCSNDVTGAGSGAANSSATATPSPSPSSENTTAATPTPTKKVSENATASTPAVTANPTPTPAKASGAIVASRQALLLVAASTLTALVHAAAM